MPTASTANESARINLRTSQEVKEMIERAAAAVGATVSSFMLQNATKSLAAGYRTRGHRHGKP
ncbi:MAG: DUF1778 domain-containing protein [Rhodoferax sp.]|nr:DUF1778 domain-containing protein [Rhodoferax sp.]